MSAAEDQAERAFVRMGHRSENQAILFLYDMPRIVERRPCVCARVLTYRQR
jgi:hypothetical protein